MKSLILLVLVFLAVPSLANARSLSESKAAKYNCAVVGKPGKIDWVKVRPSDLNNGRVILRFDDSHRAHVVRIKYWYKDKKKSVVVKDDGWHVFDKLKNGKKYRFKIRGESNCGNGKWSETVSTMP